MKTKCLTPSSSFMELNVAFASLEKMRKMNLEVACQENGVYVKNIDVIDCCCCHCLLNTNNSSEDDDAIKQFQRFIIQPFNKTGGTCDSNRYVKGKPCLICGNNCCNDHSSSSFRDQNVTVCCDCEQIFSPNFCVDCLTTSSSKCQVSKINYLTEIYDRTMLILKYSSQYMDEIVICLEQMTCHENQVGLGSSGVGVVSGALGIAAAATCLTPFGTPFLLASLLFGSGATAVQAGTEFHHHSSHATQLADKVLALHGIVKSILRVTGTLRDAFMRCHIRTDVYEQKKHPSTITNLNLEKHKNGIMTGVTLGRYSVAGVEKAVGSCAIAAQKSKVIIVGRNVRVISRTSTSVARSARFVHFAGGALSAVVLVLEAKGLSSTIQAIQDGNPCEKAHLLRQVWEDLASFPTTDQLETECNNYLDVLAQQKRKITEEEVVQILLEQFQVEQEEDVTESSSSSASTSSRSSDCDSEADETDETVELLYPSDDQSEAQPLFDTIDISDEPALEESSSSSSNVDEPARERCRPPRQAFLTGLPSSPPGHGQSLPLIQRIALHKQQEHLSEG